jgi:threonine dehydrogenase-like Zn-dependent dehydrogenase
MQAIVCDNTNESRLADVLKPAPDADEVLIRVRRVQLSVTECRLYRGGEVAHYDVVQERLKDAPVRLFGHEFCGEVEAVGDDVRGFEPGDRVYAPGKIPCGECTYCRRGYTHYCSNKRGVGYDVPGALAEYTALPEAPLCRLLDEISDAEGAAMQPLASALLCAFDAEIEPGDAVAVMGTGVMGYQCGQLALAQGAGDVYAIDLRPEALDLAADRGMIPVNAREEDPEAVLEEGTDGIGADVVFECVGGEQDDATSGNDPLAQAHRLARYSGNIVQVGHIDGAVTLKPRVTRSKSLSWINPTRGVKQAGPNVDTGELAAALVADGRVSIDEYIATELSGLESFEEAVAITLDKEEHASLGPAQIVVD